MLSIIICSANDQRFATAEANYRRQLQGADFEIIRIVDARSMAEGYNRAIKQSRGEFLLFSHDDIELMQNDWWPRVQSSLLDQDVIGLAGTSKLIAPVWTHAGPPFWAGQMMQTDAEGFFVLIWNAPTRLMPNMQALDGVWFCAKRKIVEHIGFDEQTFTSFHLYDLDFTYRAFQAGFKLAVRTDLLPNHASEGAFLTPDWNAAANAFWVKHQASFEVFPKRKWSASRVTVKTREEAIQVMTPPWW